MDSEIASPEGTPPVRITAVVFTLVLGMLSAAAMAAAYAALCYWVPVIHYVGIATIGVGFLLGIMVKAAAEWTGIQSPKLQLTIAGLCGVAAIYVAWCLNAISRFGWGIFPLNFSPRFLVSYVQHLYIMGSFTLEPSGETPTGPLLAAIWLVEAGIILGGVYFAIKQTPPSDEPLCAKCGRRCRVQTVILSADDADEENLLRIAEHDFTALEEFEPEEGNEDDVLRIDITRCPSCKDRIHVTVEHLLFVDGEQAQHNLCDRVPVSDQVAQQIVERALKK